MSYRVGVQDASILAKTFAPTFNEADLGNIGAQNIYVKTIVDGTPVPPFSMNVWRDLSKEKSYGSSEVSKLVKELSALKYGRDSEEVEMEIMRRSKM